MVPQAPDHQRIRFRREDIADLDALPSARQGTVSRAYPAWRATRRWALRAAVGAVALFFALIASLYALDASGLGEERLRAAAERAVERLAGRDMATSVGATRISLSGGSLLGLDVSEVDLRAVGQADAAVRASSLRFGVALLPLLSGKVVLSTASVSDAVITPAALGAGTGADWLGVLRGPSGLPDPDKVPAVAFAALRKAFTALASGGSGTIELNDVTVALPGEGAAALHIAAATATAPDPASLSLKARGNVGGRSWVASGAASRDPASGRITAMNVTLRLAADRSLNAPGEVKGFDFSSVEIALSGREGQAGSRSELRLVGTLQGARAALGAEDALGGDLEVSVLFAEGAGKAVVESLRIASGGSRVDLSGTVDARLDAAWGTPVYAWRATSGDTVLASSLSPDPPLPVQAAAQGTYDAGRSTLEVRDMSVSGGTGSASLTAAAVFRPGSTPGVTLDLAVSGMPVEHAKRLWPWFAGREAWLWVQQHLHGGSLADGRLRLRAEPGSFGNGQPITADELSARFALRSVSFDTAGDLPPVEEADGTVTLAGSDADIALTRAGMRLASGRTLSTGTAVLALRPVPDAPLIGRLDVAVAGEAAALAELASLEPVAALKRVPFAAGDLTGAVSGSVSAGIPLEPDIPSESLDWKVDLAFKGLSLARPIEGQSLTDAAGTLRARPDAVAVELDGKLNEVPATIALTEPLSEHGAGRQRVIELALDGKGLKALAPALAPLVSGSVKLSVDASGPTRAVSADLSQAKLQLPWIGWSKGAGIPAKATFSVTQAKAGTTVSDLTISAPSFSMAGALLLDGGGLRNARFGEVRLNRDDAVAVAVDREAQGFAVSIQGSAFDGRSLVRAAMASRSDSAAPAGAAVSVEAQLAKVTGFGGEALTDVSLSLRAGGGRPRTLSLQARTDGGAEVTVTDSVRKGRREMALSSADAGSVLRFLDIYSNMQGGAIDLALAGTGATLTGSVTARNFSLVDEPRLASLVTARAPGSDRSLGEAVRKPINTARVTFDAASADVEKGADHVRIANGVLRGSVIGAAFQGTLYDKAGQMDMTGTFMPAYGLNRLFGELPLIGVILGNGNDRGLLGVTFKLEGDAKSPTVTVNPLSLIAPGIFRRVFEFQK